MSDIIDDLKAEYKRGQRRGIVFGATATIIVLSMAYIISQGIMYWK